MSADHHLDDCGCTYCQKRRWLRQLGTPEHRLYEQPKPRAPREKAETQRLDLGEEAFNSRKPDRGGRP